MAGWGRDPQAMQAEWKWICRNHLGSTRAAFSLSSLGPGEHTSSIPPSLLQLQPPESQPSALALPLVPQSSLATENQRKRLSAGGELNLSRTTADLISHFQAFACSKKLRRVSLSAWIDACRHLPNSTCPWVQAGSFSFHTLLHIV